jgi:transcription antitermination factor NusG
MGLEWRQPVRVPGSSIAGVNDVTDDDGRAWFAVQVWTRREPVTAQHLRMRGYEVFLPCYREQRRWSDRVKTTSRALFAGYVFCRIIGDETASLITTPGVIRVLGDSHGPSPIPAGEITAIQQIVATQLPAEPCPYLQEGQRVQIVAGPLRGAEGVVERHINCHRLIVSISLLQRSVAVEIDPDWVSQPSTLILG